ncbi:hypothetical protein KSS87_000275 [Heliosperma pusillum]|nr:hypothetical protein KSS87_000275 [Heliosperma pusillum]
MEEIVTFKHWSTPSPSDEIPVQGIKGTRLFDLSAVKLSWSPSSRFGSCLMNPNGEGTIIEYLQVYGRIILMDDKGNEFDLFHREFVDAVKVPLHMDNYAITLTLEKFQYESPRCLPGTFCLVFYLEETFRGTLIVDQVKFIDTATTELAYNYDQRHHFELKLDGACCVTVEYSILQCALLACVSLIIEKIGESDTGDDERYAKMSGTLDASFEMRDGSCFEYALTDSYYSCKFNDVMKLSIFGVPAYSLLCIKAIVDVNGEKFERCGDNCLVFDPHDTFHDTPYEKELLGRKFRLRMLVKWGHPSFYLHETELCEWLDRTRSNVIEDSNWEDGEEKSITASRLFEKCKKRLRCIKQKNFRPIGIHPRLEALSNRKWIVSSYPVMLVEVFSISVCFYGKDSATLDISGTININHAFGDLLMFYRDEKNPKHLLSCEPIPLESLYRCIEGPDLSLEIDLKDHQGYEICNGYVAYNLHRVSNWLNKRLCSTVKGEHGFATVHHTIFADAVQAKLKFILKSNFGDHVKGQAFGRITGKYANFRYDTHYEKKFFQTIIFDQGEASPVNIVDSEIPLCKYVVAVPINSALVVRAHVCVLTRDVEGGDDSDRQGSNGNVARDLDAWRSRLDAQFTETRGKYDELRDVVEQVRATVNASFAIQKALAEAFNAQFPGVYNEPSDF